MGLCAGAGSVPEGAVVISGMRESGRKSRSRGRWAGCSDCKGPGGHPGFNWESGRFETVPKEQGCEPGKGRVSSGCRKTLRGHMEDGLEGESGGQEKLGLYVPWVFIDCAKNTTRDTAVTQTASHLPSGCLHY